VVRQATVRNAINLNRINLIGVYSSGSQRRALVRLSTGRYVKVKVGDRIDGGRVRSIDKDALTYTKNGRDISIELAG
jgi:type IV pilus biogenesis protein PilP